MLSLTHIENKNILTGVTEINLSEQIRSAALILAEKWTKKELELDMEFGEFIIAANPELLKQVWINLLDNAVKFAPEHGRVGVAITDLGLSLRVSVSNTGKTIPPESLARIFNRFYQADESHSSEGNGIGLSIVKKVVELHSGRIGVASADGVTTFTVELPKKQ